ncbi:CRR6 family NdhI maturation factor [Acaryochloris sp. 'Moss Beach']|uniref:CRR6 family NdhI maturation factor n=1 Tax=Acaryochloris sp. 'Moss Beach' TaxID=2740837 RepID=UPI001F3253B8|nr:CRR6 family NdhI maturation factor [Acaryochloris sp. 'Moss Beach']UJB69571.1 CRR6 family NdhI maturation factor [Acaryochloris sp. 'Moss Beach']
MTETIAINATHIDSLDLSPIRPLLETWLTKNILAHEQEVKFQIDYPQPADAQQEWSEIPEVRLWFIRLDSLYPWLPLLLDWRSGELVRYVAMLVPHQFSKKEGILFNPQALDILMMHKVFVITRWLRSLGHDSNAKVIQMAEMFGYELDNTIFDLIQAHPD